MERFVKNSEIIDDAKTIECDKRKINTDIKSKSERENLYGVHRAHKKKKKIQYKPNKAC